MWRCLIGVGQVENTGTHSKNFPSAEERRAGATGAPRQGPDSPCLLVPAASQATDQTAI